MVLCVSDSTGRECLGYDAFFSAVGISVRGRENIFLVEWEAKNLIPIGFAGICVEAICCFQCSAAAYWNSIWTVAHDFPYNNLAQTLYRSSTTETVLLVEIIKVKMAITLACVIHRVPVSHPSNQRAWVLGNGMENQSVYYDSNNLVTIQLNDDWHREEYMHVAKYIW